jgi:hypothetical protein
MFFRRQTPRPLTFSDRLDALRGAGFTVEAAGSGARVTRGACVAVLEDKGAEPPAMGDSGILVGGEIAQLTSGGFQSYFRTASAKTQPALARHLKEMHAFAQDLRETAGITSLYNESLGTTFEKHMYDRVLNRDAGQAKPWER